MEKPQRSEKEKIHPGSYTQEQRLEDQRTIEEQHGLSREELYGKIMGLTPEKKAELNRSTIKTFFLMTVLAAGALGIIKIPAVKEEIDQTIQSEVKREKEARKENTHKCFCKITGKEHVPVQLTQPLIMPGGVFMPIGRKHGEWKIDFDLGEEGPRCFYASKEVYDSLKRGDDVSVTYVDDGLIDILSVDKQ